MVSHRLRRIRQRLRRFSRGERGTVVTHQNIMRDFKSTPFPCFPDAQNFAAWLQYADSKMLLPCHDCTVQYQAQMVAEKRCVHPKARFADTGELLSAGATEQEEAESVFLVQLARQMLGDAATATLAGLSVRVLPRYEKLHRVLPERKRRILRNAIKSSSLMLIKGDKTRCKN